MGKTRRTFREKLDEFEDEYEDFRRALRGDYPEAFDDVMVAARYHSTAGNAANPADPAEAIWMSIAVNQQAKINELEQRVRTLEDRD